MVINIQKFISSTYNIPINMLKGKSSIRNSEQYKMYNLSLFNLKDLDAGWSSLVARRAHNPKVIGSNPVHATIKITVYSVRGKVSDEEIHKKGIY